MLRAGRMNRRLVYQTPNPTGGSDGSVVEGWTNDHTFWGALEAIGGREILDHGKLTSEVTHRIIRRFKPGITPRGRISLADTATSPPTSRTFRILHIENPADGRRELQLFVKEMPDGEPT